MAQARVEKRPLGIAVARGLKVFEPRAGAKGNLPILHTDRVGCDRLRHWAVYRGAVFGAVMSRVTTQEDERVRVRGRANEGAEVTDTVAWAVDQVEGAVVEVVMCRKVPNLQCAGLFEGDLAYGSPSVFCVSTACIEGWTDLLYVAWKYLS